jgi:hypothetical protein
MYRQVLDLYATSVDYDPHAPESVEFFKIVQNKLHMQLMGIRAPKSFINVPTATSRLWV